MWRRTRALPASGRPRKDLGGRYRRVAQRVLRMKGAVLRGVLLALPLIIRQAARNNLRVRRALGRENCVIQLRLKDNSVSRQLVFSEGKLRSAWGVHATPDAEMVFDSVDTALAMLKP